MNQQDHWRVKSEAARIEQERLCRQETLEHLARAIQLTDDALTTNKLTTVERDRLTSNKVKLLAEVERIRAHHGQ